MENFDIGKADMFLGDSFPRPYFFESYKDKMMAEASPLNITFKTWKGEFFQFRLGKFHDSKCMILTSTLKDTFIFLTDRPTFSETLSWAEKKKEKKPIKGSYTGYSSWGGYFRPQFEKLKKHMDEQEIYFTDEITTEIYQELLRREKEYAEKHCEPTT